MGFTRYWTFKKRTNKKEREKVIEAMSSILGLEKEKLTGYDGLEETPIEIKKTRVSFNGIGEDSYETFCFDLSSKAHEFDFCKTALKPYDRAVCACLIAAKRILGEKLEVSSDGVGDMDLLARSIVDEILGPETEVILEKPKLTLVKGGKNAKNHKSG